MTDREVLIEEFTAGQLNHVFISKHAEHAVDTGLVDFYDVRAIDPELGYCMFICRPGTAKTAYVTVSLENKTLRMGCDCAEQGQKLCNHQAQVLFNIMRREELRIFFDAQLRQERMKLVARDFGLEKEQYLDDFFQVEYNNRTITISPKAKELFKVNSETKRYITENLLPKHNSPVLKKTEEGLKRIVVFRKHKYYNQFYIELYEGESTLHGKMKNPLVNVNPLDLIWKAEDADELKFYTAVAKFQNNYDSERSESDINAFRALIKNPLGLNFYDQKEGAKSVNTASLLPLHLKSLQLDIRILVNQRQSFYEISGQLYLDDKSYDLEKLLVKFHYFLDYNKTFYLIDNPDFLRMIDFFKKHNNKMLIHQSKFEEFQRTILAKLENNIHVSYAYLKTATPKQLLENSFDLPNEKLIYLSDEGDFILITPVVKYGNVEVPVLSKKTIYAIDSRGRPFMVSRDEALELKIASVLIRQHPHFEEQLDQNHFYLHKSRFLDNGWFLDAFEDWKKEGIIILGFNELKNNKLSANKAKIDIKVLSGLDWFETSIDLKFGKEKISLKYLHKSIRNKSKFVQLGDGTLGILPDEWIEKFTKYFNSGDVGEESIRMPKVNFSSISEMYEEEYLSKEVKLELAMFTSKLSGFQEITEVEVPKNLNGILREYQQQGLSWLSFLDDFGFGGCLADDMGLGKTIQVIAFLLLKKEKGKAQTNLIVVPTTLIFNWQAEIAKFAPSLKVHTVYGVERRKDVIGFEAYDVIITSYGTMLYDIKFLKQFIFNSVFLDESQTVKNPTSLRYQAAALLKSRNKIVITGTPVENSTFDLYGQLSLANPGLLGSRQYFKDHFSTPIDKFKDIKRAMELQKMVRPFILRRTKKQVATELPDKTEMVIYCEMEEEQRKFYDSYKNEYRNFLLNHKEEDLSKHSMHVLKGLTKLRQICNSPALLKEDRFYGNSSSKITLLMEEIEGKCSQHKILVFSQFVSMLDLIRKELTDRNIAFEYLTGQSKNRNVKVAAFQNNEKLRVFLISLKAGGMGLNLTEADYVYLVDPWWNPAVENQAIDRSYRIGQKKNVIAVRLICPDTIEEKIMHLQETKKDLVNDLIKTEQNTLKQLTRKDLLELFN
ncbi:SNF2 family DNA or RNA helicase [Pedobacter sp. CG_S7]|uniref:DEAD/DEAH box helicase n=1 Tax=Pedobacter sp. CG_S7 TaxID=3143930 RepID=UPI00339532BA